MIDWLVQTMTDLPALPAEAWLSPPERERLVTLRFEKRRSEWLLGRWTAKRLVQRHLEEAGFQPPSLAELAVTPAPDGSPQLSSDHATLRTALGALRLTISHSGGKAFCALGPAGTPVGADIEGVAPRGAAFTGDYFTLVEQGLVAAAPAALRDTLVTAIWSTKESVLKVLRLGLTVDTRLVECLVPLPAEGLGPDTWAPIAVRCDPSLAAPASISCWWRRLDDVVLTLAAAAS
ncbi:MAG: 4'-phosphopantetheinyl transferase superfamily protein [Chloroflexales bacterium]|nr:4'-phosphopantetheinyl transferase superfamily protein [Chloroflexales bacterium]